MVLELSSQLNSVKGHTYWQWLFGIIGNIFFITNIYLILLIENKKRNKVGVANLSAIYHNLWNIFMVESSTLMCFKVHIIMKLTVFVSEVRSSVEWLILINYRINYLWNRWFTYVQFFLYFLLLLCCMLSLIKLNFCITASLGFLVYGLEAAWVSPMTKYLKSPDSPLGTPLSNTAISWIGSINCFTSAFFVIPFSYSADRFGRKWVVFAITIPVIVSYITQ